MKKILLTLCFVVSASFAMANNIENKEALTVSVQVLEEKTLGACTTHVYDIIGDEYVLVATINYNCGKSCTDSKACEVANAAALVIINSL